jgi:hypothetical protein
MGLANYFFCKDYPDKLNLDIGTLEEHLTDKPYSSEAKELLIKDYSNRRLAQRTLPNLAYLIGVPLMALTKNTEHIPPFVFITEMFRAQVYFINRRNRPRVVYSLISLMNSKKKYGELINEINEFKRRPSFSQYGFREGKNDGYDGWLEPPHWNQ